MGIEKLALVIRQETAARSVPLGPNKVTFLISAEETGGKFSLTEFEASPPPTPAAPLHIHHDADETIYVLEGEFQVAFGDEQIATPAGTSIFIPRGSRHTIANTGATRGRLLVFLSPPGFEGYWDEMSRLAQSAGGPVDPELTRVTQEKYHVDMLGQARRFADQ